jgi:protein TonB
MAPKIAETDTNKVYITVEQMPIFPGGENEMHKFISENLKYPEIPEDKLMENLSTTVRFVVSRTGDIKDIEATRPQYKGTILTDSLTQLIKRMPRWIPGKQNGINVNVYISIPLHVSPKR